MKSRLTQQEMERFQDHIAALARVNTNAEYNIWTGIKAKARKKRMAEWRKTKAVLLERQLRALFKNPHSKTAQRLILLGLRYAHMRKERQLIRKDNACGVYTTLNEARMKLVKDFQNRVKPSTDPDVLCFQLKNALEDLCNRCLP